MVHVCINIFSLLFALLKIIIIALVHIFQLLHILFHLQHAFMIQLIRIKRFKRYIYFSHLHFTLSLFDHQELVIINLMSTLITILAFIFV